MKMYIKLLTILFFLTILGCETSKIKENNITLPPKPQRQELKEPESLQDIASVLNYYEHLVQEWENWGDRVEIIVSDNTK